MTECLSLLACGAAWCSTIELVDVYERRRQKKAAKRQAVDARVLAYGRGGGDDEGRIKMRQSV